MTNPDQSLPLACVCWRERDTCCSCADASTLCQKHTQCIAASGHDGPCLVPAWAEVWQRD